MGERVTSSGKMSCVLLSAAPALTVLPKVLLLILVRRTPIITFCVSWAR